MGIVRSGLSRSVTGRRSERAFFACSSSVSQPHRSGAWISASAARGSAGREPRVSSTPSCRPSRPPSARGQSRPAMAGGECSRCRRSRQGNRRRSNRRDGGRWIHWGMCRAGRRQELRLTEASPRAGSVGVCVAVMGSVGPVFPCGCSRGLVGSVGVPGAGSSTLAHCGSTRQARAMPGRESAMPEAPPSPRTRPPAGRPLPSCT